jgi:hypothetical protein
MVGNSMTSAPRSASCAAEHAGLLAGAGDDDALAKQRAVFKPVDLRALGDDIADDGDGGSFESGAAFTR